MRVKEVSEKAGLKLNIQKTKIMAFGPITSRQVEGGKVETMTYFIFLDSKITVDGDYSHEIKRQLLLGRKAMTNLDSILKSRDITLPTKVCLVKAMVFPVVSMDVRFGHVIWTIKKVVVVVQSLSNVNSLWPHELQHTRLPCVSLSAGVCSNSYPLNRWCHPTISSSVIAFSSCLSQHQGLFQWVGSFCKVAKEGWAPKNWYFRTVVLEKTLESPLDRKEITPVTPKGNPILWPPDVLLWSFSSDVYSHRSLRITDMVVRNPDFEQSVFKCHFLHVILKVENFSRFVPSKPPAPKQYQARASAQKTVVEWRVHKWLNEWPWVVLISPTFLTEKKKKIKLRLVLLSYRDL